MEGNTLFYLAIILFSGLFFGRMVKHLKLPNVTGYLIAGLIIGPHILGIIPEHAVEGLSLVSEMALGFIAFSIGSEFKASYFKRVGFTPVVIAITEGVGAIILVTATMLLVGYDWPFALVIGAIASATAPAATIMVVRQYKAKGPLTETLMSVVALDDAVALIGFGFAVTAAKAILSVGEGSMLLSILSPFYEVGVSLLLGGALGFIFTFPLRWFKKESNRLCLTVGFVFAGVALAGLVGGSSLLVCMALGATLVNVHKSGEKILKLADTITPPIFMMFFVVSGAELDISLIPSIGIVGVGYVVARVIGKLAGARLGAVIMKAPEPVKKYLGFTLIPQAGVAIGLTLIAETVLPGEYASVIRAVVLCATFIYEIVGPAISKFALKKAGEIAEG
ncbi:cation:proton antiporter [Gehongia tenuis]|uniref:Cation:proton antiporter n=1 Tax=Gehongia tenuis TaxID=2763655 RepID=A0A926D6G9_9FIRM|nr:cation:proton antiporter [Gehongia tenuis]MBC8532273.1 cation:proton antiporter [Gehongia tenuis]